MTDTLQYVLITGAVVFGLWPYLYIYFKKGTNKFLFVSAVIGVLSLTAILLYIVALPFIFLAVKLLPSLNEYGVYTVQYIALPIEFAANWHFVVYLALYFLLPFMIYRKYEFFRLTSGSCGTPARGVRPTP